MPNPTQKSRQSSIVFQKPDVLPEILKILTSFNYHRGEHLLLKFCTSFPFTNVYKSVFEIFFICVDLEIFAKIKKIWFLHIHANQVSYVFINTQALKEIKQIWNSLLQTLLSRKRVRYFRKKDFKLYGSWSSSKFLIFQTNYLVSRKQ